METFLPGLGWELEKLLLKLEKLLSTHRWVPRAKRGPRDPPPSTHFTDEAQREASRSEPQSEQGADPSPDFPPHVPAVQPTKGPSVFVEASGGL